MLERRIQFAILYPFLQFYTRMAKNIEQSAMLHFHRP